MRHESALQLTPSSSVHPHPLPLPIWFGLGYPIAKWHMALPGMGHTVFEGSMHLARNGLGTDQWSSNASVFRYFSVKIKSWYL